MTKKKSPIAKARAKAERREAALNGLNASGAEHESIVRVARELKDAETDRDHAEMAIWWDREERPIPKRTASLKAKQAALRHVIMEEMQRHWQNGNPDRKAIIEAVSNRCDQPGGAKANTVIKGFTIPTLGKDPKPFTKSIELGEVTSVSDSTIRDEIKKIIDMLGQPDSKKDK